MEYILKCMYSIKHLVRDAVSEEKNILDFSTVIIAVFNIVRLYLDIQNRISLMAFSIPLTFIWIVLIFTLLDPLAKNIESLKNNNELYDLSKYFIICFIIVFTNYSFIVMGFSISYFFAVMFSFITVTIFLLVFYYKRNDLKFIWKKRYGKITVLSSLVLCLVLPTLLTLLDPIMYEPEIIISPTKSELFLEHIGDSQMATIVVKNLRGYAWDVIINATPVDSFYIYVDDIRDGEKRIEYLPAGDRVEFPLKVDSSFSAINGSYRLRINCQYSNARGYTITEKIMLPIYLGRTGRVNYMPRSEVIYTIPILFVVYYGFRKISNIRKSNE